MTLPCPKCGSTETNGTFCTPCLKELHPLVKKIKPGKLTCCHMSRRILVNGVWKPIDDAITLALGNCLVLEGDISSVEIAVPEMEWKPGIKKKTSSQAIVKGTNEDATEEREEAYSIPVAYEMTVSPEYKKQGTTYFEGVLQVRNETHEIKKEIASYVNHHRVQITKANELGNGTDYYMTDHRAVGHLARKLHKQHGGELKVNAQHFSHDRQRSRKLYRTNAFLQLPEYKKGDVVLKDDVYLLITHLGPKVQAENLRTGEHTTFSYKAGEADVLPVFTAKVTNTSPLEVLHPRTFEPITPENTAEVTLDEDVKIALDGDRIFLMPQ